MNHMPLEDIFNRYHDVLLDFVKKNGMQMYPFSEDAPVYVRLQSVSHGMERNIYLFADNENFYASGHLIKTNGEERSEKRSSSAIARLDPVSRMPAEDDFRTTLETAYERLISLVPKNAERKIA